MFHFTPWYFSINHQNMVYAIKNRPSSVQIPYPWATIKCYFQGKYYIWAKNKKTRVKKNTAKFQNQLWGITVLHHTHKNLSPKVY